MHWGLLIETPNYQKTKKSSNWIVAKKVGNQNLKDKQIEKIYKTNSI